LPWRSAPRQRESTASEPPPVEIAWSASMNAWLSTMPVDGDQSAAVAHSEVSSRGLYFRPGSSGALLRRRREPAMRIAAAGVEPGVRNTHDRSAAAPEARLS